MKLKEKKATGQPLERTTILLSLLNFFLVSEAGANKKGIEEELKGKSAGAPLNERILQFA